MKLNKPYNHFNMNQQTLGDGVKVRHVGDTAQKQYNVSSRPLKISPRDNIHMVKLGMSEKSKPTPDTVPVRLDKLPSNLNNLHLLASNPGGQTSLIPVIVSGDEIFQIQGQQPTQNNVYVLSSPSVSVTDFDSGSHGYNTSSSTTDPMEADIIRHDVRNQTGFLGYPINTLDNSAMSSSSLGLTASVINSSKDPGPQSVASPVYKSKLEKAVAQNLLMQNMAKDSTSIAKPLSVSIGQTAVQSSLGLIVQSSSQSSTVFTNIKQSPTKLEELNTNSFLPSTVTDGFTSLPETRHATSPTKTSNKVSKVAEYYKNLISGKIPPMSQSAGWKHSYENIQSPGTSQYMPQTLSADDSYIPENQTSVGAFSCANAISSFDNQLAVSTEPSNILTAQVAVPDIVRVKTYTDTKLGLSSLEAMWKLREDGILCDAVLLAENEQIKLHRLVLIGASPEMLKQVSKATEPELRLVLPSDFIVEHVMTFVYYIYHGVMNLSVHNVQQIYRLSAIFGMGQLSKFCYDFCKLAKMGHLIIDSPYQENAKQIRQPCKATQGDSSESTSPNKGTNTTSGGSDDISTTPATATINTMSSSTSISAADTFDGLSSDINWPKSEQCNIPIRKRGRTRKTTPTSLVKNSDESKLRMLVAAGQDNFLEDIASNGLNLSGKSNISQSVNKNIIQSEANEGLYRQNVLAKSVSQTKTKQPNSEFDSVEMMKSNEEKETVSEQFPDPLLSGKLDENELNRVERHDSTAERNDGKTISSSSRTTFQSQNENLETMQTVQKSKFGSKTNNVSESIPKLRRKKVVKKVQKTQELTKTNSEIRRILSNPNKALLPSCKLSADISVPVNSTTPQTSHDKDISVQHDGSPSNDKTVGEDKARQLDTESADNVNNEQQAGNSQLTASVPKKARLRKSTLDQQDLRDTVYMRPPPKKRTKEIREMMQNEEDGVLKHKDIDDNSNSKVEKKMGIQDLDLLEKDDKISRRTLTKKRQRMKNDALMAKVYEIEKMAVSIEGEKVYRCSYCSVEFKFAKRAVTHLIGTHSVYLEDTPFFVSVEMKKDSDSKVEIECEICGFKPKESGSYYIHYHKYFRHQIPLPKGWQAYKCDLCQKEFFTKFQLREHKLIHFEDNPFVCEQCGSGFRSRTCLNSHVFHKHNSIRKHKCSECPKTFKTATQVKVHQRIHSGEKPFRCPSSSQCTYRSTTRGNMKLHLTSKHKLNPTSVKKLMANLEATEGFIETVEADEGQIVYNEPTTVTGDLPVIIDTATDSGHEPVPFDILVESSNLETEANSKRLPVVADHIGNLSNKSDNNVAVFNEAVADSNTVVNYSTVAHGNLQGHDLDMVMPESGQILETQNIPRHVQLLIQDAHRYMQHQTTNSQFVSDFQNTTETQSQEVRTRFSDQVVTQQTYEPTPRLIDSVQTHTTSGIIDPHSKEARMIIKEAFSNNLDHSLLKSALNSRLEARHSIPDTSTVQDPELPHNEAEKLVKDLHDQQMASAVSQDDDVVRSLRSQIQQLREYSRNDSLFRDDQAMQDILLQNITSQQSMDNSHFSGYHHSTVSPPAYSTSGHGILSASGVVAQSNVTMTTSPDEGEGQVQQLPLVMQGQGQGYPTVTSQTGGSQYGPDSTIYPGYYQETQYDIENY